VSDYYCSVAFSSTKVGEARTPQSAQRGAEADNRGFVLSKLLWCGESMDRKLDRKEKLNGEMDGKQIQIGERKQPSIGTGVGRLVE
jgi:hypothetical protein